MLLFDKCLLFYGGNMSGNKVKIMSQGAIVGILFGVLGLINIYTGSIFDIIFSYIWSWLLRIMHIYMIIKPL